MDNWLWKWVWRIGVMFGIIAAIVTIYAHSDKVPAWVLASLFGVGIVMTIVGLLMDFKPWRWSMFRKNLDGAATKPQQPSPESEAEAARRRESEAPQTKIQEAKAALLQWREVNDPRCNLTLPSSRRTSAAQPAEDKAAYRAARERAIKSGLKPPQPTGDDDYDSKIFWQWCAEPSG